MTELRGFEREYDRDAGANQHKRVKRTDRLAQVDVVRLRPGDGSEAEHDVCADKSREEHDLRREKQPKARLAIRNRQRRLILKFRSGFVTHICSLSVIVTRCRTK